jgi:hypothetical protein
VVEAEVPNDVARMTAARTVLNVSRANTVAKAAIVEAVRSHTAIDARSLLADHLQSRNRLSLSPKK